MSNLVLNTQYDRHSFITADSIFSSTNSILDSPTKFDIPDAGSSQDLYNKTPLSKDPNRFSLNSNSTTSSTGSVSSFRTVKIRNTKILKIKIDRGEDYTVLKLRKDKLTSLQDLIGVICLKMPKEFEKIYIVFDNNHLKSLEVNSFLNDIIFDYILAKDKILIKLE